MSSLDAFLNHPIETLERALNIRKQIDQLNETLKELFGPTPISLAGVHATSPKKRGRPRKVTAVMRSDGGVHTAPPAKPKKKGGMSAEGRAKIAAAQKARWAKVKGEKTESSAAVSAPKKRKERRMSTEGRAKIVAAVKARWAKERGKS